MIGVPAKAIFLYIIDKSFRLKKTFIYEDKGDCLNIFFCIID